MVITTLNAIMQTAIYEFHPTVYCTGVIKHVDTLFIQAIKM